MRQLSHVTAVEAKLFLREPATWIIAVLVPTIILVALGLIFAPHLPDPKLGGQRWIDLWVPSMVVLTLATLGVNTLPTRLVKYREKGVLRRMSTTPADPSLLLIAQLAINMLVAVIALGVLLVVGNVAFGVPLPRDVPGFVAAFVLGMTSLLALGLLVAAVSPTTGIATALFVPLFVIVMTVGGVYLPRVFLPGFLQQLGEFAPPGVQAIQDAWLGTAPVHLLPLGMMALITAVAGAAAARLFRWE
jgi:ABC-2 type transport system permease protein